MTPADLEEMEYGRAPKLAFIADAWSAATGRLSWPWEVPRPYVLGGEPVSKSPS